MHNVCVLDLSELGRIENYGLLPCCSQHHHISVSDAIDGVRDDLYRVLDSIPFAVVEASSNGRIWTKKSSQGYMVRQLVIGSAQYLTESELREKEACSG